MDFGTILELKKTLEPVPPLQGRSAKTNCPLQEYEREVAEHEARAALRSATGNEVDGAGDTLTPAHANPSHTRPHHRFARRETQREAVELGVDSYSGDERRRGMVSINGEALRRSLRLP